MNLNNNTSKLLSIIHTAGQSFCRWFHTHVNKAKGPFMSSLQLQYKAFMELVLEG